MLETVEEVITATSWQSDLEKKTIMMQEKRIFVCAMLDHWVNYKERFLMNGVEIKPDQIWVLDDYAYKKARVALSEANIIQVKNYYLEERVKKVKSLTTKVKQGQVLFLGENIKEHALRSYGDPDYFGYNEESILKTLWGKLNKLDKY